MPTFAYTARDRQGAGQSGRLDAASEDDVVSTLQRRGLIVTSILLNEASAPQPAPAVRQASAHRQMHTRVTTDDQVLLCQQLSTLVEAGVPLLKSLEVVSAQVESRMLLIALEEVRRDVAGGANFHDALGKHPAIFTKLWLNLVETGEASGHLAQALRQLARHFEQAQHLQNEARTAMTYPMFLMGAAALVMAVFVYWLIPKFTTIFESMEGMELPLLTRMVIGVSNAARHYWVVVILVAVGGFYALRRYLQTTTGQWMRDRLLLQIPLFKTLTNYLQLAEFSRGLATLLESGVPLLSGLEILASSATNKVYGQAVGQVKEAVKQGKTMAEPMADAGIFPPMTVQMVQVGEEVGELGKMVERVARYYEERVETFIARMTRLFEPIAIVFMGGIVLVIVLSIFMPIFKMATGVNIK